MILLHVWGGSLKCYLKVLDKLWRGIYICYQIVLALSLRLLVWVSFTDIIFVDAQLVPLLMKRYSLPDVMITCLKNDF